MAVRQVRNHGNNIIGYFPSLKMGRMVAFESTIERDLLFLLDYEPHVKSFAEQPLTVTYWEETKRRSYTPDFKVEFTGGQTGLVECKPQRFVSKEVNLKKFAAGEAWCAERGWHYEVITDEALRHGFRLENVKFLTRFARHQLPLLLKYRIKAFVDAQESAPSIDQVIEGITSESPAIVRATILQMAFHNELALPLNERPIDLDTLVYPINLKEKYDGHTKIFSEQRVCLGTGPLPGNTRPAFPIG